MKNYKLTDDEIYLIKLSIAETIMNLKKEMDEDKETKEHLKKKYHNLLNTIKVSGRYN